MKNKTMKTRYFLLAICVLAFVSCKSNEPEESASSKLAKAMAGTWNLISMTDTRAVSIGNEQVEVYVVFQVDETTTSTATKAATTASDPTGTFSLYQMLGTGRFRSYKGSWTLSGTTLTGVYSNGTPWGATYEVTLDDENTRLTLAAPTETCVYTRTTLPAEL